MADALRGSMDAAEYKHVVLGLIFLKYISDAFEERHAEAFAEYGEEAAEDRDGDVVGQQVGERTIEELSAELRQIDPPAFPTVERVPVDGGREVIMVGTVRGPTRPYIFRGSAYRRVGNTTLAMSPDEYNRVLFERMHSE